MIQTHFFLLSESGLFDFDLTFPTEIFLFFLLSIVSTNIFLNPISQQLKSRAKFVNSLMQKSGILVVFGSEKIETTMNLILEERAEMRRQFQSLKDSNVEKFENEVSLIQKETFSILSQLKGRLAIQSAFLFSSVLGDISKNVDKFFQKKLK